MEVYDIQLNESNDVQITGGDLAVGESTHQHQMLLLLCNKGEFKQFPDRCVGVSNYIENEDDGAVSREIHTEFAKDGMKISHIKVNMPNIQVEAEYEN